MTKERDELGAQIKELQVKFDALVEAESKPEYPDGTPGYFWDDDYSMRVLGFISIKENYSGSGFSCASNAEIHSGLSDGYKNFTPLTEAILPDPVQHDGGKYPGDPDDFVFVTYYTGAEVKGFARDHNWSRTALCSPVATYQVIKRAEK